MAFRNRLGIENYVLKAVNEINSVILNLFEPMDH